MTSQQTSRRQVPAGLGLAAAVPMATATPPAQAAVALKNNGVNLYPAEAFGAVADGVTDDRPEASLHVPTTTAAAPAYAGQLALQDGALYVATGTASAADRRKVGDLA